LIFTVSFPIRNHVQLKDPWPIRVGSKSYFIEMKDGRMAAVGVRIEGLPVDLAPTIISTNGGTIRANLEMKTGRFVLMVEHEIRAWQTLLVPYVLLDIDFDSPSTSFKPETVEEENKIHVHNFSTTKSVRARYGGSYELYGRAFMAIDVAFPLIELMSLYREAAKSLLVGRSIDAYNGFYLFFESQFCRGQTKTRQATERLVGSPAFMASLDSAVTALTPTETGKLRFKALNLWKSEPQNLVMEIVELRGHLRHHSSNNPHRWDPDKQENYNGEARLLSLAAQDLAFPMTTGKLWDPSLLQKYSRLAEESNMAITIHVMMTIREEEHLRDVGIDLTLPQPHPDAELARFVLSKALEILEQKSPGAELFAIRAWVKDKGTELFRYDIGSTLSR
jgi:hypothetical protein